MDSGSCPLRVKTSRADCLAATADVPPIPAVITRGSQLTLRAKNGREHMQQRGAESGDAVGTPITERPPHKTVRAAFPHYGSHLGCVTAKRLLGQG
jgi:hypothetical protein